MKLTPEDYLRTPDLEVLTVRFEPGWFLRLFDGRPYISVFRKARGQLCWTLDGWLLSPRHSRDLDELRDQWEHDHAVLQPFAHFFECDCGRAHPVGWICNSPHRDQL